MRTHEVIEYGGETFVVPLLRHTHALAAERLCRAVEVVALLDALAHTGGYIRASLTDEDEAFAAHFDGFFESAPEARKEEA